MAENSKPYDLEERSFEFAKRVRSFIKLLPTTLANIEDAKQVVRASGSVASNYIEANDALSRKDFVMRIKICRKEAKECVLWLRLLEPHGNEEVAGEQGALTQEARELMSIFAAIMRKSE